MTTIAPTVRKWLRVARRNPGTAVAIAYWFATRRRMRARGRLENAVAALPFVYARWIEDTAALDAVRLKDEPSPGAGSHGEITVHVHLGPSHGVAGLFAVDSVMAQTWACWRLIITLHPEHGCEIPADPRIEVLAGEYDTRAEGLAAALDQSTTSYLVPLASSCRLPREALAAYAVMIHAQDGDAMPVIYGDQDELAPNGRRTSPWFKPDWDSDMFLAQDYLSAACALPVAASRRVSRSSHHVNGFGEACVYALLLRLAVLGKHEVVHLHRATASTPADHWQRPVPERLEALRALAGTELGFHASQAPFGTAAIQWPLPDTLPLVSIVVPTRDRLDLLQPCVEGVLAQTRYMNFEIVIADNGSVEEATLAFFARIGHDPRVRIVAWPHPYNYSAINNFAVQATRGEYLCLLNNDTEVIDGEWLGELMRQACRAGVGAVGGRLLYPDHSIQHAGVAVGMGNAAGHAHRGLDEGEPGYFAHALIARGATAVTAACLVVSRAGFDAVGGLDEEDLRIAYNDVDFCLKLRASGLRNIYAPSAVLIHHESKSRGLDMAPEHRARYLQELATLQERWDTAHFQDPMHHPVLDRSSEQYLTVS